MQDTSKTTQARQIIEIKGTSADAQRMDRDMGKLAPAFRAIIDRICEKMRAKGHDPLVSETFRTDARQEFLFAQGRTRPGIKVTDARNASISVHGYGLAVDIICKKLHWNARAKFWSDLGQITKEEGQRWGGDFRKPDRPHIQTGHWQGAPPQWARTQRATGDIGPVWERLGLHIASTTEKPAETISVKPEPPTEKPLAWGARVSPEFRQKVREISARIGCDPSDLMACMAFESGLTFSPKIRNAAGSGATGLIQFMPATARALGTTTDALAAMTAEEQLDYVEKYFRPYRGRLRSIDDLYMAILWPRAVGQPNDFVLFREPSRAYTMNKGLDTNKDGAITKAEAAAKPRARLEQGLRQQNAL